MIFLVRSGLKISNISKNLRIAIGGVCVVCAYSPVVFEFFPKNDKIVTASECIASKTFSNDILSDFFVRKIKDLSSEDILNSFSSAPDINSVLFAALTASPKKAPIAVKGISQGILAGSKYVKSKIENNFYVDARDAGVPANVVDTVIKQMSGRINFRRSLKSGDSFEIAYNQKNELQYARIITKKMNVAVYKFVQNKVNGYFFEDGTSTKGRVLVSKGTMFAPPLSGGLRLSSNYGIRIHPITKRRTKHKGVDLIAGHGTPVYAANHGKIVRASRFFGYGNCIDIEHSYGYASRYAHLSRMAVKPGMFVKKGQVIGYVGSTGRATGAHLHFELLKNNVNLNPLSIKMIPAKVKTETIPDKKQFESFKNAVLASLNL